MKMKDGSKQEKYVLLDEESDVEEYDKSKEALIKSLDGKTYIRSPRNKSTLTQPQWLCQTLVIVLLVAAQGVLSFFFLRMFWDLETIKERHTGIFRNGESHSSIFTDLNNVSFEEQLEYRLEHLNYSQVDEDLNSKVSHTRNVSLMQRVKLLELKIKFLERIVSRQNNEKALQSQHANEKIKLSEDAKMTALERKLNNVTEALNTLQKRMEEGLDATLLQISQLKDDFYFIENSLNHTDREHLISIVSNPLYSNEMTKEPDATMPPSAASKAEDSTFHENTTTLRPTKPKETSGGKHKINVPFIKNHADFQVFFYGADKDASGYLTYPELAKVLGEDAPQKEELQKFDEDDDKMYSYLELMKTFELSD